MSAVEVLLRLFDSGCLLLALLGISRLCVAMPELVLQPLVLRLSLELYSWSFLPRPRAARVGEAVTTA